MTGSRCSSDGSTTSSRERCSERASDSLSPAAREVDRPHAVLVLIPVVSEADSDVPREVPDCAERDPPPGSGSTPALIAAAAQAGVLSDENANALAQAHAALLARAIACTLDGRSRIAVRDREIEQHAGVVRSLACASGLLDA